MVFTRGLSTALGELTTSAGKKYLSAISGDASDPFRRNDADPKFSAKLLKLIAAVPTEPTTKAVGAILTVGKRELAEQLKASPDGKSESLSFLDILSKQSELLFQRLRETSTTEKRNDGELVQLFAAWNIENHGKVAYRNQINALLASFKKTELDKLGEYDDVTMHRTDTRVLRWRTDMFSGVRRLAMYKGSIVTHTPGDPRPPSEHPGAHFEAPEFSHYVPDELVDSALALHRAKFGAEPEEAF
jgi:hypothetical protein